MQLTNYKLGDLIEACDERNSDNQLNLADVRGISIQKKFIETKANMDGVSLTPYKLVQPDEFSYVTVTSRNGEKITLAHNITDKTFLVSSSYIVFRVSKTQLLSTDYLFMYFNRPEFDRFARFNSWGSARETFSLEDFCDIEIVLPPLDIQQKYVDVYNALVKNMKAFEVGAEDLKLVCDAYIEELRNHTACKKIGAFINECFEKNDNNKITLFQGVNIDHVFTEPKRVAEDSENGSVVRKGQFAFNKVMKAQRTKLPIALHNGEDCVVSNSYQVFEVSDASKLIPEYLMLWLNRDETQRYCGFISYGTTRDIFTFDDMCEVKIPIPEIEVQRAIVDIYRAYNERKRIAEELREKIKDICPILIKGSIEEASR